MTTTTEGTSRTAHLLALMKKGDDAFNERDFTVVDEVHHPDMIANITGLAEPVYGKEAHSAAMQQMLRIFPDMHVNSDPYPIQFGSGDWITVVTRATGTFTGDMVVPGGVISPTGKPFDVEFGQNGKSIILAGADGNLQKLDAATLETQSEVKLEQPATSAVTMIGELLFVETGGNRLHCFDNSGDLKQTWAIELEGSGLAGRPARSNNLLVVSTRDGVIQAIDPKSGEVRNKLRTTALNDGEVKKSVDELGGTDASKVFQEMAKLASSPIATVKAVRVTLPSATIHDNGELKRWLDQVEATVREKLGKGPVIV